MGRRPAPKGPPKEADFSNIQPHPGQMRVIEAMRKYRVVVHSPGRRWGKSSTRIFLCVDQITRRNGWVEGCCGAQSHAEATNLWEKDLLAYGGLVKDAKNEDQRRFIDLYAMHNPEDPVAAVVQNEGARLWYPSLGLDHAQFQGHGLAFAILDETSHLGPGAWPETIRPMLADQGGPTLAQGTPIPEGRNWAGFKAMSRKGTPSSKSYDPTWIYFTGKSEENPHINHKEIGDQRNDLINSGRASLAANLYDGLFVEDTGAVFGNFEVVFVLEGRATRPFTLEYRKPRDGESVVMGLDLGKHNDPTVAVVFSIDTMEMLGVMRLSGMDYAVQLGHIDQMVQDFSKPVIYADAREGGSALIEVLQQRYRDGVIGVKWSRGGVWDKDRSVIRGQDLFQTGAWKMIDVEWLREEFRNYSKEPLPSGGWRYGAPEGDSFHDDGVSACLYAAYALPLVGKVVEAPGPTLVPWTLEWFDALEESQIRPTFTNPYSLRRRAN